ncbi:RDD family protein [Agromyces atrinae]|uniref:RDD family protein n=1 Tax=Agromyces atrinae TaxID=592376 RepID=UPI001F57ED3A|nr:RDD family protein [Agromyces atrinae]MCI2958044.1 RDD family protein [Agromyces atrinae]
MAETSTPVPSRDDDGLLTGEAVSLDVSSASVFLRAAGALIDAAVYGGSLIVILLLAENSSLFADAALGQALVTATLVICLVIAPMTVETLSRGRSLGKLAIGARIVRDDGGGIRLRHAFIRALTGVLELYMTIGGIALIVSFLNRRAKRLGDLLAGTYSQMERVKRPEPSQIAVPRELEQWALTADVARLPDALARRVAQFFAGAEHLVPASRSRLAITLAADVTPFVSPVPHVHPEAFLAGVSAVRRTREAEALRLEAARMTELEPFLTARPHAPAES